MTKRSYSEIEYEVGTVIRNDDTGETFKVLTCTPLEWISGGEKKGYLVNLRPIKVVKK